jgi:hypothetical protein
MRTRAVGWMIAVAALVAAQSAQGEIAGVKSPKGNPGTLRDLGNGLGIPSDPHEPGESRGIPREFPVPSPGSHGDANERFVTPFGSPQPPNQLTPAPLLPFHPNRPPAPPTTPPSGSGRFNR